MFGDNNNSRSVGNCPVQGTGASILRKGIQLCQDAGLKVIFPLHDALYIECSSDVAAEASKIFLDKMREAFVFYFKGTPMEEHAAKVMMDLEIWGYSEPTKVEVEGYGTVQGETIHIDERGISQYKQFSKYFEADESLGGL